MVGDGAGCRGRVGAGHDGGALPGVRRRRQPRRVEYRAAHAPAGRRPHRDAARVRRHTSTRTNPNVVAALTVAAITPSGSGTTDRRDACPATDCSSAARPRAATSVSWARSRSSRIRAATYPAGRASAATAASCCRPRLSISSSPPPPVRMRSEMYARPTVSHAAPAATGLMAAASSTGISSATHASGVAVGSSSAAPTSARTPSSSTCATRTAMRSAPRGGRTTRAAFHRMLRVASTSTTATASPVATTSPSAGFMAIRDAKTSDRTTRTRRRPRARVSSPTWKLSRWRRRCGIVLVRSTRGPAAAAPTSRWASSWRAPHASRICGGFFLRPYRHSHRRCDLSTPPPDRARRSSRSCTHTAATVPAKHHGRDA